MSDDLNFSAWIERRVDDVGPYANIIVKGVQDYESRIKGLKAERNDLKAKLAMAVGAFQCWSTMLDNPQYDLGEMAEEFTTIVRTTLKELTSSVAADDEVKGGKDE